MMAFSSRFFRSPLRAMLLAWRALPLTCQSPDVSEALNSGEAVFEMPFSLRPASAQTIVRGTFDCLVRRPDGRVTVLELKTGHPAPAHAEQLAIYLTAARALYPDAPVDGKLVYAGLPFD